MAEVNLVFKGPSPMHVIRLGTRHSVNLFSAHNRCNRLIAPGACSSNRRSQSLAKAQTPQLRFVEELLDNKSYKV